MFRRNIAYLLDGSNKNSTDILQKIEYFKKTLYKNSNGNARRMQCTNHLKQLTIALHNYSDKTSGMLPYAGWYNSTSSNPHNHSWQVRVFPYIEQQTLYEPITPVDWLNTQWGTSSVAQIRGRNIRRAEISILHCPSDNRDKDEVGAIHEI
jgi:hypothetical protein